MNNTRIRWRALIFPGLSCLYLALIYGLPTAAALSMWRVERWTAPVAPAAWIVVFLVVAGVLSRPHQASVRPGKFRRDLNDPDYFHRRLYGLCWTAVCYNTPAYYICLSIPVLKWLTFRLFGYRGSMNFTVYPDTWIRDLPLLEFEDGVYVSNRATLGTNIVLGNGTLLVGGIKLRRDALVGHLAVLGPGVEMEADSEVGVGAAIGLRAKLRHGAVVGARCGIAHGVSVGRNVTIGPHSYVDSAAIIQDDVHLPARSTVASRSVVRADTDSEARRACA